MGSVRDGERLYLCEVCMVECVHVCVHGCACTCVCAYIIYTIISH